MRFYFLVSFNLSRIFSFMLFNKNSMSITLRFWRWFCCSLISSVPERNRNCSWKIFQPLRTKALSQKCLSYLGPFIWNGLPVDVKLPNNVNTFKHKGKKDLHDIIKRKRSRYRCILWVNYHHYHLILIMELQCKQEYSSHCIPCF